MNHTYWVSIGRNTSHGGQLRTADWLAFRSAVRTATTFRDSAILAEVDGSSEWNGEQEETYLVLVSLPDSNVSEARFRLQKVAAGYHQDAIGFVGGPGTETLIFP